MSKKNRSDPDDTQSTNKKISRRGFIGNTLIGSGAALLGSKAPGTLAQTLPKPDEFKLGKTMPLPLNDLDKKWDGPSGVGDYASANGNTHDVVNMAHTFRNGDLESRIRRAKNTQEEYDMVIVGAGFAGVSSAYYYLQANPDAKILILDNHKMFGGEARHNEFEVDGYKLWAPQGSTGAVWPLDDAKKIQMYSPLWDELKMPTEFTWQEPQGSNLRIPKDNYTPMHIGWEVADLGWHHDGHDIAVDPWNTRFKDVPIDEQTKKDFMFMEVFRQPPPRGRLDGLAGYHDLFRLPKKCHEY